MAGVINAYAAMMAQRVGFRALYLSGAGVANYPHGMPDLDLTTLNDVEIVDETSNRERTEKAFRDWQESTGSITDLLADDLTWTIVGRSQVSKTYTSKEEFIEEVLGPFGARFSRRFRPVDVRGVYADGDTVIVLWEGEGTRLDGKHYRNTYAWFMRFREGLVVEATAFFDSIAFDELWSEVAPTD